ncbi:hypothetical protein HHOHNEGG_00026 [Clostridium phage LPCPA6]|uniref:Uncharacterized protein n=1 Tax=Clostridium phage LPCPA6 TaxID=2924884 RepID=A0AAE9G9L0_9CAUD|nr:hypothetical protein PQC33_gp26 [Clostridium phage LPCPA6]UNY47203.1 hypothetical protein HHOHNEGG_00026 [Clostridium phage LPCPA6]
MNEVFRLITFMMSTILFFNNSPQFDKTFLYLIIVVLLFLDTVMEYLEKHNIIYEVIKWL